MGVKKIFLSSAFRNEFGHGFKYERNGLKDCVRKFYKDKFDIVSLDDNIAMADNPVMSSLKKVEEADIVVLFLGEEYGRERIKDEIPDMYNHLFYDEELTLSLTHLEFRLAKHLKKHVLCASFHDIKNECCKTFYKEIHNHTTTLNLNDFLQDFPSLRDYKDITKETHDEVLLRLYGKFVAMYILHNLQKEFLVAKQEGNILNSCAWRPHNNVDNSENHFNIISDVNSEGLLGIKEIREVIDNETKFHEQFDQKYLYYSVSSVQKWSEMEKTESQSMTSEQSSNAFTKFLLNDIWKELIFKIDTVVDLGVGIGEKSIALLESFAKQKNSTEVDLIILDSSPFMLEIAYKNIRKELNERLKTQGLSLKYKIDGFKKDFMKLDTSKDIFQGSRNFKTIFCLLGGTFGNIKEDVFLESLKNTCEDGDLFLVGIFLLDSNKKEEILQSYKQEDLKELFSPSFHEFGYNVILVEPKWADGKRFPIKIDGSQRINFHTKIHRFGDEVERYRDSAYSTRYNLQKTKDYIKEKGFVFKAEESQDDFAYILFEFKKPKNKEE